MAKRRTRYSESPWSIKREYGAGGKVRKVTVHDAKGRKLRHTSPCNGVVIAAAPEFYELMEELVYFAEFVLRVAEIRGHCIDKRNILDRSKILVERTRRALWL